jgi:hypothetical protein
MGTRTYFIPEGPSLKREIKSAVDEAIYEVLGGPSAAAEAVKSSRGAIGNLVANQPIKDRATALKIEHATIRAKRKVPAAELMDLVPWQGPKRHGSDPDGNGKGTREPGDVVDLHPNPAPTPPETAPASVAGQLLRGGERLGCVARPTSRSSTQTHEEQEAA